MSDNNELGFVESLLLYSLLALVIIGLITVISLPLAWYLNVFPFTTSTTVVTKEVPAYVDGDFTILTDDRVKLYIEIDVYKCIEGDSVKYERGGISFCNNEPLWVSLVGIKFDGVLKTFESENLSIALTKAQQYWDENKDKIDELLEAERQYKELQEKFN